MGRHFPVKEILESLEKLGKITQKPEILGENSGNFRQILFVIFSDI